MSRSGLRSASAAALALLLVLAVPSLSHAASAAPQQHVSPNYLSAAWSWLVHFLGGHETNAAARSQTTGVTPQVPIIPPLPIPLPPLGTDSSGGDDNGAGLNPLGNPHH